MMHKWLSTFGTFSRQKVKTGQSQVRVIGSLSCTCQVFYMQNKHKTLRHLKIKKYVSHKCMRAALPAVILFKVIWLRALVHDKIPHTDTLVLPALLTCINMGVVLSVLSRMCSCALLGFSPMQGCKVCLTARKGARWGSWVDHCWGPSMALCVPLQLPCLCAHTWLQTLTACTVRLTQELALRPCCSGVFAYQQREQWG